MAGPWEAYQQPAAPAPAAGPWQRYQPQADQPAGPWAKFQAPAEPNFFVRHGLATPESSVGRKGLLGSIEDIPADIVAWFKKTPSVAEQNAQVTAWDKAHPGQKMQNPYRLGMSLNMGMGFGGGALGEKAVKGAAPEAPRLGKTESPASPEAPSAPGQPPAAQGAPASQPEA